METEVCRLCGTPDQDKQSDHIRECYKIAQDKLSMGQYHPRLYSHEMDKLQRGSNPICSNMAKCRDRRSKVKEPIIVKKKKSEEKEVFTTIINGKKRTVENGIVLAANEMSDREKRSRGAFFQ